MKGVLIFLLLSIGLIGLVGCVTVPRHYTYVEEVIYYPPPPPPPPEYYYPPVPPTPPVYNPPAPETRPPRDRQPVKPKDSYQQRDPIIGGSDREGGEINTFPPIRNPEQKDTSRQ